MTTRLFVLTLLCVGLLSGPAFAMSKNCNGGGEPTPTPIEQNLQDILDGLVVSGPPIDASAPSPFELFFAGSTGITAQIITTTGVGDGMLFGLYPGDDPTNHPVLLSAGFPTSYVQAVSFTDDGTIRWGNDSSRSGFDGPFGFFAKVIDPESTVFIFTEDALNSGGTGALVFQGNGETRIKLPGLLSGIFRPDQFILAFDADGDGVFGDMVVAISGIDSAVPEPGTALLIGVSLLALVRMRRS